MSFFEKFKSGAAKAADKAQRTVESTKLSALVTRKRKEIKDHYATIGAAVYNAHRAGNPSIAHAEITRLSDEIHAIEESIAELNVRISLLSDIRICACGHRAAADATFCPTCGRKFDLSNAIVLSDHEVQFDEDEVVLLEKETPVYEGIETNLCSFCRKEMPEDVVVCPHCKSAQVLPGHDEP